MGHEIGKGCRIGMSYLDIHHIRLEDGAQISGMNYFKGLDRLELGQRARIGGRFNWFTASRLHKSPTNQGWGILRIGPGSNITSRHYFDIQDTVTIGKDTLIAGFRSTFWTHGYRERGESGASGITIGDNCYIGSQVIFVPGSAIGNKVFVGAGSVVTKDMSIHSECLIGGNPATMRKQYDSSHDFFQKNHSGFTPHTNRDTKDT